MPKTPYEYALAVLGALFFIAGIIFATRGAFLGGVLLVVGAIFVAGWLVLAGRRAARS